MKKLLSYSFFLFLDKGLSFVLPILLLYITSPSVYAKLEAALAMSILLIPLLDLGTNYYVGFIYKRDGEACFRHFNRLLLSISLFSIAVAIPLFFLSDFFFIIVLAILRSVHINLYQYGQTKGRLTEKLISPILANITASTCAVVLTLISVFFDVWDNYILLSYFIFPPLLFIFLNSRAVELPSMQKLREINYKPTLIFIKKSLTFAAPAILNTLLVTGFANLTKIYVLQNFGESDMVRYSFVFRLAMIIQLCHMAVSGYTFKFFLLSINLKRMASLYLIYMSALFLITLSILCAVYFVNNIVDYELLYIDPLFIVAFAYTLFWCYSAFFDFLYIRINKTKLMLVNSGVFFLSAICFYFIYGVMTPLDAAIGLFISSITMFISNILLCFLNRHHLSN